MSLEEPALLGGQPAVQTEDPEQWERETEREAEAAADCVRRGEMTGAGTGVAKQFEDEFREYIGAEYCLTTDHGSSALASAYYAVGVGPGDEVIVPTAGYIGAYEGALHMGARPVFCDIDPDTLLIDPDDIEEKITERTRAVCVIHFNGRICDMDRLLEIGDEHGVAIVEDAAHAHGTEWDGRKIGSFGDIACFSLQATTPHGKPVAGGEGGVVTTNNREFYERQLAFCHLHRKDVTEEFTNPEYRKLDWEVLGKKNRAYPPALAVARVSMDSLDYRNERRTAYRNELAERFEGIPGVRAAGTYERSDSGGLYGGMRVVYEPDELDGLDVERWAGAVRAEGVYLGGPGFPYMEHRRQIMQRGFDLWGHDRGPLGGEWCGLPAFEGYEEGDFPVAEDIDRRTFKLSTYIEPVDDYVDDVVEAFRTVAEASDQLRE
jgi:dTDP-4-amino-4,6-dideoxygalactose transaminase